VIGGDGVADGDEDPGALDAGTLDLPGPRRSRGPLLEERRFAHVRRVGVPVVGRPGRRRERGPSLVAVPDPGVLLDELVLRDRFGDHVRHVGRARPEVPEEDRTIVSLAEGFRGRVEVDPAGEGVGHDQRRRCQVARADLRVDTPFEVAVPGQDRDDVQVLLVDPRRDVVGERPGVADARRTPESDEIEAELLEVRRQPRTVQVVGHDPRSRCERRLHPRLRREAGLDRALGEQAGADHDRGVRRVRA
jgi:hypothetical protein